MVEQTLLLIKSATTVIIVMERIWMLVHMRLGVEEMTISGPMIITYPKKDHGAHLETQRITAPQI
jgi:hypothetical protein